MTINSYQPLEDVNGRYQLMNAFKEKSSISASAFKSGTSLENTPAGEARWLIETSINNEYAHILDPLITDLTTTTTEFYVQNAGIGTDGEPILEGASVTMAFQNLENELIELNCSDQPVYLSRLEVKSFDGNQTLFESSITTGRSYDPTIEGPIVIKPWQDPVPFQLITPPYPLACGDADRLLTQKLNCNRAGQAVGSGYLVETITPCLQTSWISGVGYNRMWHGVSNSSLTNDQMNHYLTEYKDILDECRPNGFNNEYISHVLVSYIESELASTIPEQGFYWWHSIKMYRIRITEVGQGS